MDQIQQISSKALQRQTVVLSDGSFLTIVMYFRPMQQGWFFNELTRGAFTVRGLRICNSPNMLFQWQNVIPFGLACFSDANREPSLQEDFSSGASKLYILSAAEVAEYTAFINGSPSPS